MLKNTSIKQFHDYWEKSAKASKKTKKNTGGIKKDLKEARKQLAGFDEMNVLGDNTKTNTGGIKDTDDLGVPSLAELEKNLPDLSKEFANFKPPQWLTDILEFLTNPTKFLNPFENFLKGTDFDLLGEGITNFMNGFVNIFVGAQEILVGFGEVLIGVFTLDPGTIWDGIKKIVNGIVTILVGAVQLFIAPFQMVAGLIKGIFLTIGKLAYTYILTPILNTIKSLVSKIGSALSGIPNVFSNAFKTAKNKVASIWSNVSTLFSKGGKIFNGLKDGIVNTFKTIVNNLIKGINSVITKPFKELNKTLNGLRNTTILKQKPFKGLWKENPIPIPTIPTIKMAKGGIVNLPSRGVPLGNAIAGERGMEGVIPLTDSQQMALLGEAIGKYITINANITNTMNGRVLSRELQKIQNEEAFGSNRW